MFNTIDRWTRNIRISRKISIAPAVAIVLLSLMAPLALRELAEQSKLLEAATTTAADKAATVAALSRTIPEASSLTNRIIALASNSDDAEVVKRLIADMNKRLGDAASLIGKMNAA